MQLQKEFERYGCCVIIPTYNNERTLEQVISEVLSYTRNIIIVNDGATDSTFQIIQKFKPEIDVITHKV
ncbi:MAG: glycosyltransferase, partial [Cyclobacteriaceae bacterium]|nr:glycosyltransferase [Cyclobacteriaceae bacterium]